MYESCTHHFLWNYVPEGVFQSPRQPEGLACDCPEKESNFISGKTADDITPESGVVQRP